MYHKFFSDLRDELSKLERNHADLKKQNNALSDEIGDKETARDLQEKRKVILV